MKKIDFVLKAIMQKPGIDLTSREVGKIAGLSASQASQYLSRLADEGKIQRIEVSEHNLRYLWRFNDPKGILKPIIVEAIRAGTFGDVIREALPTNAEDKTVLLSYFMSETYVQTVSSHPNVITTEATA